MNIRDEYPKNKWVRNSRLVLFYFFLKKKNFRIFYRTMEYFLGTQIYCPIPDRLFLPHPFGVIVGGAVKLGNNVVLMQQVTLGGKDPHLGDKSCEDQFPILEEGVYVGAGAKVLGKCTIGKWSIIGANAVVTKDIPPYSLAAGIPAKVIKSLK